MVRRPKTVKDLKMMAGLRISKLQITMSSQKIKSQMRKMTNLKLLNQHLLEFKYQLSLLPSLMLVRKHLLK